MRILAIRGQNLASLREFEVDLEALDADGGLFAITGPTGAGKSTILDALCLALYDKTPRLNGASTLKVGRGPEDPFQLGANDVRTLLRRGAVSAYAQVDFVGQDGGHYRAEWKVHRARGKPDGKLQDQSLSLVDLLNDQQVLHGATKSETLKIIEEKVGLAFDQFRRSVLLAQGEFDAFLRAPAEDRGKLLERMTGTAIYRRLSLGAHLREKSAREALALVSVHLEGSPVLSASDRAQLEADVAQTRASLEAVEQRREVVAEGLRWHQTLRGHEAHLAEALGRLTEAETRWAEAAERRALLGAVQAAEPLRMAVEATDQAQARQVLTRAEADAADGTRADAEARLAEARHLADAAAAQLAEARHHEAAARPALAEARRLDAVLAEAERRLNQARAAEDAAAQAAQAAQASRDETRQALAGHEDEVRVADTWLAERTDLAPLADQWDRWHAELQRWAAIRRREHAAEQHLAAALATQRAAEAALPAAQARAQQAEIASESALRQRDLARAAADAESGQRAQAALQHLAEVRQSLARLQALVDETQRLAGEQAAFFERAREAHGRAAFARARADSDEAELRNRKAHYAEARRSLELTRSMLQLADHRASLVPGQACPLCGALDHPGVSASSAVADAHAQRVRTLEHEVSELEKAIAAAKAKAEAADGQARQATDDAHRLDAPLAPARDNWLVARMSIGDTLPEKPDDPGTSDVLAERRHDLDLRTAEADARLKEVARRNTERDRAEHLAEEARSEREAALAGLGQVEAALQQTEQTCAAHQAARLREHDDRQAVETALMPVLLEPDWVTRAAADAAAFIAQVRAAVEAYLATRARRAEAEAEAQRHRPALAALEADATTAGHAAQLAASARKDAQAAHVDGLNLRVTVLDGQPADQVERSLAAAVAAAQNAQDLALARREETAAAARGAQAHHSATAQAVARADAEHHAAATALADALAQAALAETDARALLARGLAWQHREAEALATLAGAAEQARAVVAEREADRTHHLHTATPEGSEDDLIQARQHLKIALEDLKPKCSDLLVKLQKDSDAHQARAALAGDLNRATVEHDRWRALDDLIGSGDGKAFANFAQSLTLEAVLAHANRHLNDLHRRYQLMRVPGEDLALQVVDRDMGNEIRPLQSLSGGETFLVSLALALGLASLVSESITIDSLFIDEGFGTLDPETLDTAIEALSGLHASGRNVGIISHVPGLDERIGTQVQVVPRSAGLSEVRIARGR